MFQDKSTYAILAILAITVLMIIAQLSGNYMLFAYTMPTLVFAFIFLGSIKKNKLPTALAIGWTVLFVFVLGTLLTMIKISEVPENITSELVFGLPKATAILLGLFWAATGLLTTAFYSLRFDKDILSEEDFNEFKEKVDKN